MSGIDDCAMEYTPTVVRAVRPATTPAAGADSRHPIQYVKRTTPAASSTEGNTAVRTLTAPVDQEVKAINHTTRGGFMRCG